MRTTGDTSDQGEITMHRIDEDTFVITTSASGRTYVVHRRNRSKLRARWDVCNGAGGRYGTFATLPGARSWALTH